MLRNTQEKKNVLIDFIVDYGTSKKTLKKALERLSHKELTDISVSIIVDSRSKSTVKNEGS